MANGHSPSWEAAAAQTLASPFPSGLTLPPSSGWKREKWGAVWELVCSHKRPPWSLAHPQGSPMPRLGKRWAWSSRNPEGTSRPLSSGECAPPHHVVEQGPGAPHLPPSNSRLCGFQFPSFPPWLGVVHPVSYHVSECVGGFCTNSHGRWLFPSMHHSPPHAQGPPAWHYRMLGSLGEGGGAHAVLWS